MSDIASVSEAIPWPHLQANAEPGDCFGRCRSLAMSEVFVTVSMCISTNGVTKPLGEKGMKVLPLRPVLFVVTLYLLLGCSPCNDTDRVILNVNDHAFTGPELAVVTFNLLHGFGDAVNDATLDDRLDIVAQEMIATLPDAVLFQEASVTLPGDPL